MEIEGKHALVTGGAVGIGLEITRALSAAGASVLVVGRDQARMESVARLTPRVTTFVADLTVAGDRERLIEHVSTGGTPLDILVNNAGTMQYFALTAPDAQNRIDRELALDLQAPIHLATALLPRLLERPEAAIVNVTTGLVYAPFGNTPAYSAAKAGLHAFTRSLRWQTRLSRLKVLELLPPTVATEMTARYDGPKIKPAKVAADLVEGLRTGRDVVRPGQTKALYVMARLAPGFLFNIINNAADRTPLD
ncbi:SDR family NAD(P)-dependent oxidoreductase [Methylobacterium sp.]|uniref:SDR family oxidoreductase n=1 Tax=Methylobacterium sp. TaxID=409 RepID=UPI0025D925AF|nr:SDR family NAD(P)-dependent oxidoreductase [Methylobacterium sp.]MBY0260198.1 SDR family NAD(P)-dependent oxidoreductase [Methylobacterium sp.]